MGHTVYWNLNERGFSQPEWNAVSAAADRIVNTALDRGMGVSALFTGDLIRITGNPGCETFQLYRCTPTVMAQRAAQRGGRCSDYCKTRRLPYHQVVLDILVEAHQLAPVAVFGVCEDGSLDPRPASQPSSLVPC